MVKSICAVTLLFSVSLLSENAMAKSFYKASISLEFTYSNAFKKTQTLERKRVQVVMTDDSRKYDYGSYYKYYASFCQLKIDQKIYQCQSNFYNRRNYSIVVSEENLKQILQAHFNLSTATVLSMNLAKSYSISRSWSGYGNTDTHRKTKIQLHTDKNDESYHLIATARKARLK